MPANTRLVDENNVPVGTATSPLMISSASNVEASAFTTTNTPNIGQTPVLVSAAYPGGKRSILNDGTVPLRLVESASKTTGGLLLAVGVPYVIDGQNPLSAAIFAYAPSGTGSVSEIRQ